MSAGGGRDAAGAVVPPPILYVGAMILGVILNFFFAITFLPAVLAWTMGVLLIVVGILLIVSAFRALIKANTPLDPSLPTTSVVKSGAKFGLFGSFGVIFLTTLAVLGLAYSNIGADFLAGAGYYAFAYGPNPFPVIPNLTLFAGIISNNAILVWFIGIGVIAGFVLVAPQCMVLMSRILFGYSFDRIMPRFVAEVSDRWHTPLKGILMAAIGGEIFLALLSGVIGPSNQATAFLLYSYAGLATIGITFTFVSISAIVFPFLRKELFQTTNPAARRVAGVPVITWLGIISLIYGVVTFGYYTYNYNFYFGAGTLAATSYFPFLGGLAALFVICITWYVVVRVQRKKQGLPFERIFKEIPPE